MGLDSTREALMRQQSREAKRSVRRPRHNKKPEFEFKKIAVNWLADNDFKMNVVESKAVYNYAAGRYDHGQTEAGFSDLVGVTPYFGVACYIELKAPGKRSTLEIHQRDFLIDKIKVGAFCCCIDSVDILNEIYLGWLNLRKTQRFSVSKEWLINWLPKVKELTDNLADITG
jgi:hypothetical protein